MSVFFFAWVDAADTAFSAGFQRQDESVFSFELDHSEGNIPMLHIAIKNPRVGLLNPGRKTWAWLSWLDDAGEVHPVFFGRLVGIQTEFIGEEAHLEFIARPEDYVSQKQLVAESLKTSPAYDPIFLDVTKRDDPDAILEGHTKLYHVDPITLQVTASGILVGEDGTLDFGVVPGDAFYDSVKVHLHQPPLRSVTINADVQWKQEYRGSFEIGKWTWPSLSEEPVVKSWPKAGTDIGGGYTADIAWAGTVDPSKALAAAQSTLGTTQQDLSYQWQNIEKTHHIGDTMSINVSYSPPPPNMGPGRIARQSHQIAVLDPDTVDANGDPDPTNIPAIDTAEYVHAPLLGGVNGIKSAAYLTLRYQAARSRRERLSFTLQANLQPVLSEPLVVDSSETIDVTSGDLSLPLGTQLNWQSVAGQAVAIDTIIFPNNPTAPNQLSAQIAISGGTAGTVEPIFSNVAGQPTSDGSVVWSSLGASKPVEQSNDWLRSAQVSLGTQIVPRPVLATDRNSVLIPGLLQFPPVGAAIARFELLVDGESAPGATISECTQSGVLGGPGGTGPGPVFSTFTNPSGQFLFICVQAGVTGQYHTTLDETPGARTTDGTAVWQCVGPITVPVGGWPGMTPAAYYFPTDRGLQSVEHLIHRARAKLAYRARCVEVSWDTTFRRGLELSCRMNATLTDPRIPGGIAAGKVISYKICADGESGRLYATVTIGCTVGQAQSITVSAGTPTYAAPGYAAAGWQAVAGSVVPLGTADVGYTPPVWAGSDDGLVFPLQKVDVVLTSEWNGFFAITSTAEITAAQEAIAGIVDAAIASNSTPINVPLPSFGGTAYGPSSLPQENYAGMDAAIQAGMDGLTTFGSLWYTLALKPINIGPFSTYYIVDTTPLELPKTIDLTA